MLDPVRIALRRIQEDLAGVLDARHITAACRQAGYLFRKRLLDPITTIQLFVVQILHGNFAVARLQDFTDEPFSEAASRSPCCRPCCDASASPRARPSTTPDAGAAGIIGGNNRWE